MDVNFDCFDYYYYYYYYYSVADADVAVDWDNNHRVDDADADDDYYDDDCWVGLVESDVLYCSHAKKTFDDHSSLQCSIDSVVPSQKQIGL